MNLPTCPQCHSPISASSPGGVCPACLLRLGMDSVSSGVDHRLAATTPGHGKVRLPSIEVLRRQFPQLEITDILGQGGMGTVYRARQVRLDRPVALKILHPDSVHDPAFTERFMREARTLARLNHPGIVGIHDFGEITLPDSASDSHDCAGGRLFYIIMEYVDGANLRALMQSGRLSPELALAIIRQICEALQYAHQEGVVHRDIKPENILMDAAGRVRIADFGLAKPANLSDNWTLTGTHQVMGTPRYMAPEQMSASRNVDHRADLYSLGVMLYEMLTGTIPAGHFAPPSEKSPIDVRLDSVVLRAMAADPEVRFQSASDLWTSIAQISRAGDMDNRPWEAAHAAGATMGGMSTLIDREIVGAWRLISDKTAAASDGRTVMPMLLILLLTLSGAFSVLLPWFEVDFRDPGSSNGATESAATADAALDTRPFRASANDYALCYSRAVPTSSIQWSSSGRIRVSSGQRAEIHGFELQTGMLSAVLFGIAGFLWLIVPQRFQSSVWMLGGILILAGCSLLMVWRSRAEALILPFDVKKAAVASPADFRDNIAGDSGEARSWIQQQAPQYLLCQEVADDVFDSEQSDVPRQQPHLNFQAGFAVPVGSSMLLLILGAAALRTAIAREFAIAAAIPRTDSVTVTRDDLEAEKLPDVCMVCGCATTHRITRTVQVQPKWAEAMTAGGMLLGGIPGLLIALMTTSEFTVPFPVCFQHRHHWRRPSILAGTGWLLPIVLGGMGFLAIWLSADFTYGYATPAAFAMTVAGALIGLALYLIPVITMSCRLVKCEKSSGNRLILSRVCSPFAAAVRRQQTSAEQSSAR